MWSVFCLPAYSALPGEGGEEEGKRLEAGMPPGQGGRAGSPHSPFKLPELVCAQDRQCPEGSTTEPVLKGSNRRSSSSFAQVLKRMVLSVSA